MSSKFLKHEHEAEKLAQRLMKRMRGDGWSYDVWHIGSRGWLYCVRNGGLTVYPIIEYNHESGYHVALNTIDRPGGSSEGTWEVKAMYNDPNEAVAAQMEKAKDYIIQRKKVYNALCDRLYFFDNGEDPYDHME